MKFIHLAPRRSVARIAKNGLRAGNGIRGRGVYAIPLMQFPQFSDGKEWRYHEGVESFICSSMSAVKLWKSQLFGGNSNRRDSSFASVVFKLSEDHWPVRVFLGGWPEDQFNRFLSPDFPLDGTDWKVVGQGGWLNYNELEFIAQSPQGLGLLMKRYRETGRILAAYCDDYLEVVINSRIPARNIVRIVAHYEQSQNGKRQINDAKSRISESDLRDDE
jgi:hypothetical protein